MMQPSAARALPSAALAALALAACHSAAVTPQPPSVTVYPVSLAGRTNADVANVVGILLERGGAQRVELEPAAFVPDGSQELAAEAAAFATFVSARTPGTEYALFADIRGTQQTGIEELRAVLVDSQSRVAWSERLGAGEPAWDAHRPREPMECCTLLAQRLRPVLHLGDPMRSDAPESRLAARMQQRAGVPPHAELDAMDARLDALRELGDKARIRVYPPRVGSDWSAAAATDLAARLAQRGLPRATAASEPLRFATDASANEQQVLWSAARAIQQAVRSSGPQTDYLLFCDFLLDHGAVGAVHTFLLSPAGELVVVDLQNAHHADFARIAPASAADGAELAAARIAARLRP